MDFFENKVLNFIRENAMLEPGSRVVVGFSGGADSTALMYCLYELRKLLKIELIAVHVHHGIREDADHDAEFVKKFCEPRQIQCIIEKRDVPFLAREWKMTEEEAGRKARYQIFEQILSDNNAKTIAVAHHQNDVAETLLLNLVRGTGLHGAGAIRPVRENVIRPLLCVSRKEIEEYLKSKGQDYCTDYTNAENDHARNIIRNVIMPKLEESINSAASAHLCRAAFDFATADDFIEIKVNEDYKRAVISANGIITIDINSLRDLPVIVQNNVILKSLEELTPKRKDITAHHVDCVRDLMKDVNGNKKVDLPYGLIASKSYDKLEIRKKETLEEESDSIFCIPVGMKKGDTVKLNIPDLGVAHICVLPYNDWKLYPTSAYTKWFDYDRIQEAIFRRRMDGDHILLEQGDDLISKKLNKLFTDMKVPARLRDKLYLLADGNNVIWVPGVRMSAAYKVSEETGNILEIIIDNGGISNG